MIGALITGKFLYTRMLHEYIGGYDLRQTAVQHQQSLRGRQGRDVACTKLPSQVVLSSQSEAVA